jgi:hypothetical protein
MIVLKIVRNMFLRLPSPFIIHNYLLTLRCIVYVIDRTSSFKLKGHKHLPPVFTKTVNADQLKAAGYFCVLYLNGFHISHDLLQEILSFRSPEYFQLE